MRYAWMAAMAVAVAGGAGIAQEEPAAEVVTRVMMIDGTQDGSLEDLPPELQDVMENELQVIVERLGDGTSSPLMFAWGGAGDELAFDELGLTSGCGSSFSKTITLGGDGALWVELDGLSEGE